MSIKNKAEISDQFKSGKLNFTNWLGVQKGPEKFFNSDEFRKIKNRNRKKKH